MLHSPDEMGENCIFSFVFPALCEHQCLYPILLEKVVCNGKDVICRNFFYVVTERTDIFLPAIVQERLCEIKRGEPS